MADGPDEGGVVVVPIGTVRSALRDVAAAPRQPDEGAPGATLALRPDLLDALAGLRVGDEVLVLTWLHRARRDVLTTRPRDDPDRPAQGTFGTRSPDRPNPIGLHRATITGIDGADVEVDHLEAIDGTPIVDLKPVLGPPSER